MDVKPGTHGVHDAHSNSAVKNHHTPQKKKARKKISHIEIMTLVLEQSFLFRVLGLPRSHSVMVISSSLAAPPMVRSHACPLASWASIFSL